MKVVVFDRSRCNALSVGEERYFLLQHQGRPPLLCNERCPHRGGPLHLGTGDPRTGTITCPWHDTIFPRRALEKQGVPTVRTGDRITVVLDVPLDAEVTVYRRERIIANEHS